MSKTRERRKGGSDSRPVPKRFRAFRIHNHHGYEARVEDISLEDLNQGDLTIRVAWSGINYKDALAGTGKGRILRNFPLVGGIDAAGVVVESDSDRFKDGDRVIMTGAGLSENFDGGYTEYLRLDSQWAIPLPAALSLRESMIIGTAGFTAALSLHRMEASGQKPSQGPILVTGATGGVGSIALDILTRAGYQAHALTQKSNEFRYLKALGAAECIARSDLPQAQKPLESGRWAGCIDSVGGELLGSVCAQIRPWGNIASCGLAGGIELNTTVLPFIIRGISLIGIDSPTCPYPLRKLVWNHLASDWKPRHLEKIATREVGLDGIAGVLEDMLAGRSLGRTVVRIGGE